MDQDIAIVILNYNGAGFLQKFLPSVLKHSAAYRIIVADNASTDHSVQVLQDNFPQVEVILLQHNSGYAGGYNEALRQLTAKYYVLLNSDVEVSPLWVPPLLQLMESKPDVAACQPKILAYHQPAYFEYAGASGGFLDWLGYPFCRGRIFDTLEKDLGQYNQARPVFWATGACMMVKAEVFWELGGFDEDFFAHMEEIDLCWRMHAAGYQVWTCPSSQVYHVGGGTLPKENPRKTYLNFRNGLWMLIKNTNKNLFQKLILRILLDWLAALQFLSKRNTASAAAVLKSHLHTLKHVEILYNKRQELRKLTKKDAPLFHKLIIWEYFFRKHKKFSQLEN